MSDSLVFMEKVIMAFNGKLLEFADKSTIPSSGDLTSSAITWDELPMTYIFRESYVCAPNRRQDLDPYRDADGYLHRNTLAHTATTIQFQTKPMWQHNMDALMAFIRNHYTIALEKKVALRYYSMDTNGYKTGVFYVPDIEFTLNMVLPDEQRILYNSTTLEFIEY